ncbi:hypothetical protein F5Y10DRAFT_240879 [Nemania abortiva]|nr:hypothetical protein F5Y10DRAFT_240879 [Nemania abortiva]
MSRSRTVWLGSNTQIVASSPAYMYFRFAICFRPLLIYCTHISVSRRSSCRRCGVYMWQWKKTHTTRLSIVAFTVVTIWLALTFVFIRRIVAGSRLCMWPSINCAMLEIPYVPKIDNPLN